MKEDNRLHKREKYQRPPGKIIRIEFNDWTPEFKTAKCMKFIDCGYDHDPFPFEYNLEPVDQSFDWLITTTEEDLRENGYEELLEPRFRFDPDFSIYELKDFPTYKNPKLKKNGKD